MKKRKRTEGLGSALVIATILAAAAVSWIWIEHGGVALDGRWALLLYGLTETGGVRLVPVVLLLAVTLWGSDATVERPQRRRESRVLLLLLALALPAAASLNEFVLKPIVAEPRPSIVRLAEAGIIPDLSAYLRLDAAGRRDLMAARVPAAALDSTAAGLSLHPAVLAHWMHETGFSFPSGHALNAFIAAVLFMGATIASPSTGRWWVAGILLGWAVAVAWTRVLLLVHGPADILAGALLGSLAGGLLLPVWRHWTRRSRGE